MNVSQLMTGDVAACRPEDTLNYAAQLMWDRDCGCIPVIDDAGTVIGMLTDRDALMAAYFRGEPLSSIRVVDVMSRDVKWCRPDDDVMDAERRMQEHQIRRMPVVENGRLVGVLSINDIALAADHAGAVDSPTPDEVGETLAAIGQHRFNGQQRVAR